MTVMLTGISAKQAQEEIRAIKKAAGSISTSRAKARAFLIQKGFIPKKLKLTKRYSRK